MATYRYWRWSISDVRTTAGGELRVQQVLLRLASSDVTWPGPATVSGPELIHPYLIGNLTTGAHAGWYIFSISGAATFDAGTGITADSFYYLTSGASTDKDPVSWLFEGSNDGSTWDLLHTGSSETITTDRVTWTQEFPFASAAPRKRRLLTMGVGR